MRIFLGVFALVMSFGVAFLVGSLERLRSNAYFGDTSKKLIDTTIERLDRGDAALLPDLKKLRSQYHPTYETRSRYQELVDQFAAQNPKEYQPAPP